MVTLIVQVISELLIPKTAKLKNTKTVQNLVTRMNKMLLEARNQLRSAEIQMNN